MSESPQHTPDATLKSIIEMIREGEVEVYRNKLNHPYIKLPLTEEYPKVYRIYDDAVREWIAQVAWCNHASVLPLRHIRAIMTVLAGQSFTSHRRIAQESAVIRLLETEPLIAVIVEFMSDKETYQAGAASLWNELFKLAKDRRLLNIGKQRFPGGPNVFTKKLKCERESLATIGITIDIQRKDTGCEVTLKRTNDDPIPESSSQPSGTKVDSTNTLSATDDRQARIERLANRRSTHQPEGRP